MDILTPAELNARTCRPCEGGVEACTLDEAQRQTKELGTKWDLIDSGKKLSKKLKVKNFAEAMKLLNAVADVAEADQHHPDLHVTGYRHVGIELTTHAIGGLSENDFILAAKIDNICKTLGVEP